MNKEKLKEKIKAVCIVIGIIIAIYLLWGKEEKTGTIPRYELTEEEQLKSDIEELKEKNNRYQEEISELETELEEIKINYKYDEELIELLQDQLESYGIEPYEL